MLPRAVGHLGSGPEIAIQGDRSGFSRGVVDIKTKVAFQYMHMRPILKHNFSFDVNRT